MVQTNAHPSSLVPWEVMEGRKPLTGHFKPNFRPTARAPSSLKPVASDSQATLVRLPADGSPQGQAQAQLAPSWHTTSALNMLALPQGVHGASAVDMVGSGSGSTQSSAVPGPINLDASTKVCMSCQSSLQLQPPVHGG